MIRILRVELGSALIDDVVEPAAPTNRIVVACRIGSALITVQRSGSEVSNQRSVNLRAFSADAHPRVVALAAIELLAAVTPNPAAPPVPETLETQPAPEKRRRPIETLAPVLASEAHVPTGDVAARWQAHVFFTDRNFLSGKEGLDGSGVGLALERRLTRHWALVLDTDLTRGTRSATVTQQPPPARMGTLGGGFGAIGPSPPGPTTTTIVLNGLIGSAAASLQALAPVGPVLFEGGLGWRAGLAHLQMESSSNAGAAVVNSVATSPWSGPLVTGRMRTVTPGLSLDFGFEAGWTVVGTDQRAPNGNLIGSLRGPWLCFLAGLALAF